MAPRPTVNREGFLNAGERMRKILNYIKGHKYNLYVLYVPFYLC